MSIHTAGDHLRQGRDNLEHAEWLLNVRSRDATALQWAVTAAFYSALHGLSSYLASQGLRVTNHQSRLRLLSNPQTGVPLNVLEAYRRLEEASRGARYELWIFTATDVRDLLDTDLATVAAFTGL